MTEASDLVELTIGGQVHRGWKEARVEVGIDTVAHSFQLTLAERWPGEEKAWVIEAGSAAKVSIGGETLISGYIDVVEPGLSGDDHTIRVSGRAKAADLIDCSAVAKPGSWKGKKLEEIATELAKPFGITVTAEASTAPAFKAFALQPGETVFEAIARMAKMRGLLVISDADGNLHVVRPKPTGSAIRLEQGKNLKAIVGKHNVSDRFSEYLIKGQAAGDDGQNGKAVSQPKGEAKDPGVKRYRPLIIVAEDQTTLAAAKKRAEWEATVRAAKAQEATATVVGWRTPAGQLWKPLQLVDLVAPASFISSELLVSNAAFVLDESGTTVDLTLAYPEAYRAEPIAETADAAKIKGKGRSK